MGVPKFYRWLSERYPKINQVVTNEALLPEFDHLYLDMNGIIHGCTHPSHLDVSDVLSERDMIFGIFHYLDRIITQIVKPKVSVFLAIDGVAPRAKLNQQRSRRFRSAKDLAEAMKSKRITPVDGADVGAGDPYSGAFDSNCITPGTEFMYRISNCIRYFIRKKIKEDPLWKNIKVIFSGPDVPGEGEHKIMQHIRDMRNQPEYQPNTRHCMYGQDADLIMLGLVSHEPHFTLLREIIDFSGSFTKNENALKEVKKFTKQSDFQLLHLSILREYLQLEFVYRHDPKTYDLERIIDDFVFMTFLIGNDFLPHMPSLDISDGAFTLLFETYKQQRSRWGVGEYLTNAGTISDPSRLEGFLKDIGAAEADYFEDQVKSQQAQLKKQRKREKREMKHDSTAFDIDNNAQSVIQDNAYHTMVQSVISDVSLNGVKLVAGWMPETVTNQKDFKGRYYFEKLKLKPTDLDGHLALRKRYIEGLIWCLAYYYRGCISWGWFFPYHYGPMISDLTNFSEIFKSIKFDVGQPLKPFEQLMGCLPPASAALLPRAYRTLMCSHDSPIKDFYPTDFIVDMNGKRNPWETINILPFIDVNLLTTSIEKYCPDSSLTSDEHQRNRLGKVYSYSYDSAVNDTIPSCNRDIGLPNIVKCNSRVDILENHVEAIVSFKPELIPGTKIPYPGFPSLNVLPIEQAELKNCGINCFGFPSKYPNMILTLRLITRLPDTLQVAQNLLGRQIYVNWPMMHEAKVVAVSDSTCEIRMVKKELKIRIFSPSESERWNAVSSMMTEQYLVGASYPGSGGVFIGDVQIRFKVVPLQGMKISPVDGSSKKLFGNEEADIPLQMALLNPPAPDPRFIERGPITLKDRFPPKSRVVVTKGKYRGCIGNVLYVIDEKLIGVNVQMLPPEPPFGLAIARSVQESYISAYEASKILRMDPRIFGKVTANLFVSPGRYNLGLNLKYKDKRYVLGYTRVNDASRLKKHNKNDAKSWLAGDAVLVIGSKRMNVLDDGDSGEEENQKVSWEFTPKAVRLVAAYRNTFPQLFVALGKAPEERYYDAQKLFGPKGEETLPVVLEWLKSIETAQMPRIPYTTDALPVAAVHAIQRAVDVRTANLAKDNAMENINMKIPALALYKEGSVAATDVLLASEQSIRPPPELGDRVANLCANGVPFGARGTVVAIHDPAEGCVEIVLDEEFIGGSTLQGTCANFRGKLCVWNHLLKISASDSNDIVNEIIPVGHGRTMMGKLMNNMLETEAVVAPKAPINENSLVTKSKYLNSNDDKNFQSPSTKCVKSTQKSSKKENRQAGWKEAQGPSLSDKGFQNGFRKEVSGQSAWYKLVSGEICAKDLDTKAESTSKMASDSLMTILGIKNNSVSVCHDIPTSASEGLKAILKVGTSNDTLDKNIEHSLISHHTSTTEEISFSSQKGGQDEGIKNQIIEEKNDSAANTVQTLVDASKGLKAILGICSDEKSSELAGEQHSKESAANVVLQLMMKNSTTNTASLNVIPEVKTPSFPFNFTHVRDGEIQQPQHLMHMLPNHDQNPPLQVVRSINHNSCKDNISSAKEQQPLENKMQNSQPAPVSGKKKLPIIPSAVMKKKNAKIQS